MTFKVIVPTMGLPTVPVPRELEYSASKPTTDGQWPKETVTVGRALPAIVAPTNTDASALAGSTLAASHVPANPARTRTLRTMTASSLPICEFLRRFGSVAAQRPRPRYYFGIPYASLDASRA